MFYYFGAIMRIVVLFFLTLCFFISGLSGHTQAETYQNRKIARTIKFINPKSQSLIAKSEGIIDDHIDLINVEDDEDDFVSARKYVLLGNYFATLVSSFISSDPSTPIINKAAYCQYSFNISSYKYLTLRVLRI
jgi:hypothetical protein